MTGPMSRAEYREYGGIEFAKRGIELPHAKLDDAKVEKIRANVNGWTAKVWADYYGVHVRTINKVRDFRSWTHVK